MECLLLQGVMMIFLKMLITKYQEQKKQLEICLIKDLILRSNQMSKEKPEVGDVWRDRDNEIVYIVKVYKNTSVSGTKNEDTYRILEYTNQENVNVMECWRDDLVEYLGVGVVSIKELFDVAED